LAPIRDKESTPVRNAHWSGAGEKEPKELVIARQHALVHMCSNWDDSDPGTSEVLRGFAPVRVEENLAARP
jgi:hypothetical protein